MILIIEIIILIIIYLLFKKFIKFAVPSLRVPSETKKVIIILILIIILISLYFLIKIDKQLYYYGKSDLGLNKELPFKIVPQYWGYDRGNYGFVLESKDGLAGIGQGAKYWTSDVEVNEIIGYGFNKEKLLALVNDSLGKEYYVVFEKKTDTHLKQALEITVLPKQEFASKEQFKWIKIKNNSFAKMEEVRNYLELFLIFLALIAIYILLKNRKNVAVD